MLVIPISLVVVYCLYPLLLFFVITVVNVGTWDHITGNFLLILPWELMWELLPPWFLVLLLTIRDPNFLTLMHICTIFVELLDTLLGNILDPLGVLFTYIQLAHTYLLYQDVAIVDYLSIYKLDASYILDVVWKETNLHQKNCLIVFISITQQNFQKLLNKINLKYHVYFFLTWHRDYLLIMLSLTNFLDG